MKANELRIGNLVYDNLGSILKIKGISLESELSHIKPIPLTEEWLLKFGFLKSNHYDNFKIKTKYGFHSIKFYSEEKVWIYNNDDSDAGCYYVAELNSIHSLQNLYFALTNEELIYNHS